MATDLQTAIRSYDEVLQVLAQNIRQRRHQLGITQVDLARRIGISSETLLTGLELGRHNPSLRTLTRIAAALESDLLALLTPTAAPLSTPRFSPRQRSVSARVSS